MANVAGRIFRVLHQDVLLFAQALERIDSRATMRTTEAGAVRIAHDSSEDAPKFDLGPVLFALPDRWTNTGAVNLFVIVKGWIEVTPAHDKPFVTQRFGTKVAYFRRKEGGLAHIFGAHYDFESKSASHPYFHAQMSDQAGLLDEFGGIGGFTLGENAVENILEWVRIPAAQMDFLVVPLQLAADHLLQPEPSPEAARAFLDLRKTCATVAGATGTHMEAGRAPECFRGVHWYDPKNDASR